MQPFPEYFLQTQAWADFWCAVHGEGHKYSFLQPEQSNLAVFVYTYPWHLKNSFLYVPKGPIINNLSQSLDNHSIDFFFQAVLNSAKEQGASFIKLDFEERFTKALGLNTGQDLFSFLQTLPSLRSYKLVYPAKILQFLGTITLNLQALLDGNYDFTQDWVNEFSLKDFYGFSLDFWKQTNENIRRYTKKSLDQGWVVDLDKTDKNFEDFWEIYEYTSQRHKFATHSKDYTYKLFRQSFSRLIILRNAQLQAQAGWFGITSKQTLTYLYGGNSEESLNKYGQYMVHLVAIGLACQEGLPFYDLGGYDKNKGFGKFKEGYRGIERTFLGPVDVVLEPIKYHAINAGVKLAKKFSSS